MVLLRQIEQMRLELNGLLKQTGLMVLLRLVVLRLC